MANPYYALAAVAWLAIHFSDVEGQEVVKPTRVVSLSRSQSQVREGSGVGPSSWIILHRRGLTVADLETDDVADMIKFAEPSVFNQTHRQITPDAEFFARRPNQKVIIGRTSDGRTVTEFDALPLLNAAAISDFDVAGEAMYGFAHDSGKRPRLVRIDFAPTPHISASHDVGRFGGTFLSTAESTGYVVFTTSDDSRTARGAYSLQILDHQLRLLYQEKLNMPYAVYAVVGGARPLFVLFAMVGTPGSRVKGEPSWLLGEYRPAVGNSTDRSQASTRIVATAKQWIHAAAISPDREWLVISRVAPRTTLGIWSITSGTLHREVVIEGGKHDAQLLSSHVIGHLAFSQSGRFLCASDASNAYLFDFSELTTTPTTTR